MTGYFCSLCNKTHQLASGIGRQHYPHYLTEQAERDRLADIERSKERKPSKEESDRKLYGLLFGGKNDD